MITQEEYKARRNHLAKLLPENSLAIIPAAKELIRNGDTAYRFRQDSNFYYLTGFEEPEALLIISHDKKPSSILFNRERNPDAEQWTGRRLGQEDALAVLGMDKAYPINRFAEELPLLLLGKTKVFCALNGSAELIEQILQAITGLKHQVRRGIPVPQSLNDLEPLISDMRLFKSAAEIALMREAARISVAAHQRAMRVCKKLQFEHQLEAELLYEFTRQGCRSVAYDSIVASGANACVLHYTDNNKPLHAGDLVLIDAGGEYQGYAADITRTFPINGTFSPEQKSIYELVLKAHDAGIAAIKPGLLWHQVQKIILEIITTGLCELGILQGQVAQLMEQEAYKAFYMHNSGHWLGLDVHDSGAYKINNQWRPLEPGMVLTVEPGLYISPDNPAVDKKWWGIGVRIEDDVLVTKTGHDNLTQALPAQVHDIEALMREHD